MIQFKFEFAENFEFENRTATPYYELYLGYQEATIAVNNGRSTYNSDFTLQTILESSTPPIP